MTTKNSYLPDGQSQLTVIIPEETHEQLRDLAYDNERSVGAEVRLALKAYLKKGGKRA